MNMKPKVISVGLSILAATNLVAGQVDFGAYYTQWSTGQEWEGSSRTGPFADIVVQLAKAGGKLVFWRLHFGCCHFAHRQQRRNSSELLEVLLGLCRSARRHGAVVVRP